jgi:hypothetical protein
MGHPIVVHGILMVVHNLPVVVHGYPSIVHGHPSAAQIKVSMIFEYFHHGSLKSYQNIVFKPWMDSPHPRLQLCFQL